MSMEWTDTERKIINDDMKRNLKIVLDTHPTDIITHPKRTLTFIRHHNPHPPGD